MTRVSKYLKKCHAENTIHVYVHVSMRMANLKKKFPSTFRWSIITHNIKRLELLHVLYIIPIVAF